MNSAVAHTAPETTSASILIIDDEPGTLETLADILREDGHRIVCAETGNLGLEYFKKEPFHAVLLDFKLPDWNGLDILEEIIKLVPEQRVIVMTGFATIENAMRALNQGAFAYVTKPYNPDVVKAFIKQAIQQYELAEKKKQAEEEIKRLKEYNDNILTSLPFAIIIFDQSRTVEYANSVYLNDFNLEKERVVGRDLFEVLPFPDAEKERIKMDAERFLSKWTIEPKEVKIGNRTFGYRFFSVYKGPHEAEKTGLIMRDRTMETKLQQQLVQSEKLAGIGTMATGIAHEINNPLFSIMGMAEAVLDESDPSLVKEYVKDIIRYSTVISGIVKGLTVYSRSTEAGELKLVDVHESLNEAIKIVRHSTHFNGVETVKDYKADRKIMINSGELQQVFVNIIHNAIQAMNGKGRLQISTMTAGGSVVIKIKDDGPGIPEEHLGSIFDPFFTTKDPDQGTGLGLNIAYRIVQKYHGTIDVESEVGKGATFTITFPHGE